MTVSLANAMVEQGLRIDMVLLRGGGSLTSLLHEGIRVVDLQAARVRHGALPLFRYLRRERPSLMIAHMYPLNTLAVACNAAARRPSKVIAVEHTNRVQVGETSGKPISLLERWLLRCTYMNADRGIAVSDGAARALETLARLDQGMIESIPNAVSLAEQRPGDAEAAEAIWPKGSDATRIISVGTLKRVKNYGYLLEAFAEVAKHRPVQLVLVGDGSERSALEAQVSRLGLSDRIVFAGQRPNPAPLLRSADVFALSSLMEGLPTVLIEALACGLKIVSTDCESGPREILCPTGHPPYGRLVQLDDITAFSQAIVEAVEAPADPDRQRRRAEDYSPERIASLYLRPMGLPVSTGLPAPDANAVREPNHA